MSDHYIIISVSFSIHHASFVLAFPYLRNNQRNYKNLRFYRQLYTSESRFLKLEVAEKMVLPGEFRIKGGKVTSR
jgi:hypothetical protein